MALYEVLLLDQGRPELRLTDCVLAARRGSAFDSPCLVRELDEIAEGEDPAVGQPQLRSALAEEEHFVKSH